MPVTIRIPTPLRRFTHDEGKITVDASTVGAAIRAIIAKHEQLGPHLLDKDGRLRNYVNVFVNEENIAHLKGEQTPIRDGDAVMIVPAIAGGAGPLKMAPQTGELSQEELIRYSRHLLIPQVGVEGQKKLRDAKVLIVGLGGLGAPIAQYLAAAGVGRLGLVEFDKIDLSNLQRQVIYSTDQVGASKAQMAKARIVAINPHVQVDLHEVKLTSQNALALFRDYDVVVDGTDNFPTRYLVNDACVLSKKPYVYGSIFRFEGQVSVFGAPEGPCYRCLYAEPPPPGLVPSCAEGGVLGVLPGIVGAMQANEAIKLIAGIGEPLVGRLLLLDALDMNFVTLNVKKNPDCRVCGQKPSVTKLIDYEDFCGLKEPEGQADGAVIRPVDVKRRLDRKEDVVLLDVREPFEFEIAHIPGSRLIPMSEVPQRINELDPSKETVVFCHHGGRSAAVAGFLRQRGFQKVRNLSGGIAAWSETVDPSVPQY